MKKVTTILLILALILIPNVLAQEDFSAQAKALFSLEKCTSEKNTIRITNTGTEANNYELTGIGETKDWMQYPGIFAIEPGKSANAETIIQIPCKAKEGNYRLITYVSTTTGLSKEIIQDLIVKPTQNIYVTADAAEKTIKPCTKATYTIHITNPSGFQEKYTLDTNNPDAELSSEEITLQPNETKTITLTIEPKDCTQKGEQTILFSARTQKTELIAELDLILDIEDYGVPELAPGVNKIRTYYNENEVDIDILNTGRDTVSYILSVEGADWITVEPRLLSVAGGEKVQATLNLAPTEEIRKGKYIIKLTAEIEETGAKYERELTVKLTTHGIIDNLFDKYLPLTILIIIALIVLGIISAYAIQYMSTEEYQKRKLQRMREKEKLRKQREKEKELKRKEKERLRKEREAEKQRIREEREKEKQKTSEAKLRLKVQKQKETEREQKRKEKEERKTAKKYEKQLRKDNYIISKQDVFEGKKTGRVFARIIFAVIILALIVIAVIFIKPLINNLEYVLTGLAVLIVLFILGKIRRKRAVKTKWKGITLAKEKRIFDVNWKKGLQQIKLTLESPINNLRAKAIKGRGRNERYICIDEHIYQYFRADANTEEISEAETTFRIPRTWLKKKKIDEEEVALYLLDNGEWKELETKKTGTDEKYVYYKGYSEKLGLFALIGTETAEEIKEKEQKGKGILALVGIIAIALAIFLILKPTPYEPTAGISTQQWLQGEQQSIDLTKYFQDPDGDILEFAVKEDIENIDVWFKDGTAYLTPDADFTGERTAIFTADDKKGGYAESNPIKLIVKNKTTNWISKIIKYALGIIILLAFITAVIKLILMIKKNICDE